MPAALLILALPDHRAKWFPLINLAGIILQSLLALVVFLQFEYRVGEFAGYIKQDWITIPMGNLGMLSIDYHLGVDSISVLMVLLTGIVMLIGAISSFSIQHKRKGYFVLYALLSINIMGCFVALDFFLFYLFFEFMLLPMYFLIGLWGGKRSAYASIKFFLYTLLGSVFILIVMIGLYLSTIDPAETSTLMGESTSIEEVQRLLQNGQLEERSMIRTFSIPAMADPDNTIPRSLLDMVEGDHFDSSHFRYWAFLLLFLGFAIKLPMVPVHTWLPDAHVEAPTPISVVLAGILLKIGGYGFYRFCYGLFPEAAYEFGFIIGLLGVISIIYGGLNAMAQRDLKKLIAYSSVSHMGFVLLGLATLTEEGLLGAMFMMFSHGLTSSASFLIAGVIYDRTGDRLIENYSGLASQLPRFTFLVVVVFFASLGLPGFSGFVAELLTFLGAFASAGTNSIIPQWLAILALVGLIISAAYYLWTIQRMFFGEYWVKSTLKDGVLNDLTRREWLMILPLALLMLLFGILPNLLIDPISEGLRAYLDFILEQGQLVFLGSKGF